MNMIFTMPEVRPGSPAPKVRPMSVAPTVRPIAAQGNALGSGTHNGQGLKGRPKGGTCQIGGHQSWVAPSGLRAVSRAIPRALPWAGMECPVGAEERHAAKVDQHLKRMQEAAA